MQLHTYKIILLLFILATPTMLSAQIQKKDTTGKESVQSQEKKVTKYTLKGVVAGETDDETLPGAHIYVGADKKPTTVTNAMGEFTLKDLLPGETIITASFVGYNPTTQKYLVKADTNVGIIRLLPEMLEEVVITAKPPLIIQKGDTTEYNASAVKVPEDAELEDLLKKLPGFQIIDGKLMANGEEVKKIYIDGTEYFLSNPMAALQTLPANLVAKIKMFDGKSEEADFSGYDDGKRFRSLNIETKNPNLLKIFGKAGLGYGVSEDPEDSFKDNNYNLDASANAFNRKQKFSIRGSLRNTNQGSDLPNAQYHGKGGNNRGKSFSADFSNTFKKGTDIGGSYNGSGSESYSASSSKQEYFPSESYQSKIYDSESHSWSESSNHNVNTRFNYSMNEKNRFYFTPSFSFSKSDSRSINMNSSIQDNDTLNITNSKNQNHNESHSFGGNFSWMHAFSKTGRTFTLNGNLNVSNNKGNSIQQDSSIINKKDTLRNLINTTESVSNSYTASASYSEPLTESARLSFNYSFSYNKNESDKESMSYKDALFTELIGIDTALTNKTSTMRMTNNLGINYGYYKEKISLGVGGSINLSKEENRYEYLNSPDSVVKNNYLNLSPRMNFSYTLSKRSNLNFNYSGNTTSPSADQLQDILDVRDQLNVSKGNPDLKKTFSQSASMSFSSSLISEEKFSFLHASVNFNNSFNNIASATQFINNDTIINGSEILRGARLSMPVNLNGQWSISTNVNYSFGIKSLKLRLNPSISYSYSHTPSIYDNIKNFTNSHNATFNLGINSNISENLDYNISSRTSYSSSTSTTTGGSNSFTQSVNANAKWVFWKEFILAGDYSYTYTLSKKGGNVNQSNSNLNLEIGKKFLKRKQLQVRFKAMDILRQRNLLNYSIHDLYTQTRYSTNNRNYYMLTISYRFNTLGKKSEGRNRSEGGTPPGFFGEGI